VGIFIIAGSIIVTIFSKIDKKEKIKVIVMKLAMFAFVALLILLYLLLTKSLEQFIDYTFLGLGTFSNNQVTYLYFLIHADYGMALFSIVLICLTVLNFYKSIKLKDSKITKMFIYSLSIVPIACPITDSNHILIAFLPMFVLALAVLFKSNKELDAKTIKSFSIFVSVGIVILIVAIGFNSYKVSQYTKYEHYNYIQIADDLEEDLSNVTSFIRKYPNTYILSSNSVLYMIPLNRYNGIWDLPNVGNLGAKGDQVLIDYIDNLDNVYILTWPSEVLGGTNQNSKRAAEYIEDNFEFVGILENFEVYYKND